MSGSMPDFGNQKVNMPESLFSRVYSLLGEVPARADSDKDDEVGAEKWGR